MFSCRVSGIVFAYKTLCVLLGPFLAHQGHALRLLNWLRKLMGICEGFRLLLADIIMKVVVSHLIIKIKNRFE